MLNSCALRGGPAYINRSTATSALVLVIIVLIAITITPLQCSRRGNCRAAAIPAGYLMAGSSRPPVAERKPLETQVTFDGHLHDTVQDPYSWLRDDSRSEKEVIKHLEAENDYADTYFSALAPLIDSLASDMDSRLPSTEISQPYVHGSYIYYSKRSLGEDYWNYYRMPLPRLPSSSAESSLQENNTAASSLNLATAVRAAAHAVHEASAVGNSSDTGSFDQANNLSSSRLDKAAGEQLVLDENLLSGQHSYWDVYEKAVSADGSRIAFTYDTVGGECYSLQVLEIATGRALLPEPITNCAGDITWWGQSSSIICFTARDSSLSGNHDLLVKCLQLQQSEQQQQSQQQQHAVCAVLYKPAENETGISLGSSTDKQYLMLTSYHDSMQGAMQVLTLPTGYPLNFSSSSNNNCGSSSSNRGNSSSSTIVPVSAWLPLITTDDDLDVLKIDHISSTATATGSSSSSSIQGLFAAIVDDDDAPDGEVVLIATRGNNSKVTGRANTVETLVYNRMPSEATSEESSDSEQDTKQLSPPPPQQQQQSLEVLDFKVHAAAGYMAVAVRRQGECAVDIYRLKDSLQNSSSNKQEQQQQQNGIIAAMVTVPKVVLLTNSSKSGAVSSNTKSNGGSSSGGGSSSSSSDYITLPNHASFATSTLEAELSWVLVLDDPTLILDLEGLVGPEDFAGPPVALSHQGSEGPSRTEPWLVVRVSGITTPSALYYVNLGTKQNIKVYQEFVLGYQAEQYTATLEWATSADGIAVPMTLAYRTELLKKDGTNKAILHGYGAYGSKQWPSFNPADLAVLDQGGVLAVAHVRGGGELGAGWHVDGKKFSKKNTFLDYLACAQHLVAAGYTNSESLAVWGRSAGGLAVAAALNIAPGCAKVAVLDVPFLDVINTMRDPGLPLTVKERAEWGNPLNDKAAYDYIKSYSPYSNVQAAATYPALLLTASLHDTRVNFWEPAKYVAAMRYYKQQQQQRQRQRTISSSGGSSAESSSTDRPVLLLTDMHAGHFAASAASTRLEERAMKVAFILHNLGMKHG